jgi:hypothetical protein
MCAARGRSTGCVSVRSPGACSAPRGRSSRPSRRVPGAKRSAGPSTRRGWGGPCGGRRTEGFRYLSGPGARASSRRVSSPLLIGRGCPFRCGPSTTNPTPGACCRGVSTRSLPIDPIASCLLSTPRRTRVLGRQREPDRDAHSDGDRSAVQSHRLVAPSSCIRLDIALRGRFLAGWASGRRRRPSTGCAVQAERPVRASVASGDPCACSAGWDDSWRRVSARLGMS